MQELRQGSSEKMIHEIQDKKQTNFRKHTLHTFIPCNKHARPPWNYCDTVTGCALDYRNMNHGIMHFTACYFDSCYTHQSEKEGANYYPRRSKKERCPAPHWENCGTHNCQQHLFDKRINERFPGLTETQQATFEYQLKNEKDGRFCENGDNWWFCLFTECRIHKNLLIRNGFMSKN